VKRLFWNTIASSFDTAILLVLSLIVTPVLIKNFGVELFGVFVFLNIFSIYGALSFFDLGMEGALMTHVARYEAQNQFDQIAKALNVALVYYGTIGVILSVCLAASGHVIVERFHIEDRQHDQIMLSILLVSLNIFFQFIGLPFVAVLQGMHRFTLTKSINAGLNIIQYVALMGVAVIWSRLDIGFLCITAITAVRTLANLIIYARGERAQFVKELDKKIFADLRRSSNSLFMNRLIGLIYNQVGKFLIWLRLPIAEMTVFDVVSRPAAMVKVLVGMVYSAVIPEVARLSQLKDFQSIKLIYIRLIRYSLLLVLPIIVIIAGHASSILIIWIGPEFGQHGALVQLLMFAMVLMPFGSVASTVIVGLGMVGRTIWISLLGTAINVILAFALVDDLGVTGLVLAILIAELMMAIPYTVVMSKILAVQKKEILVPHDRIILMSFVMLTLQCCIEAYVDMTPKFWLLIFSGMILHYAFEVLFFLTPDESLFLKSRFK